MNAVLLIVDVQNDFLEGGALAVPRGKAIVPVVNRLQTQFEIVIASTDWHPADHCSFASAHRRKRPGDAIRIGTSMQMLWPDHCVQRSPGASFASDLDITRISHVVRKGKDKDRDSYSAFLDNDRAHATGLEALLRKLTVDEVHVCGLATDYCVQFTALDAAQLGFEVHLYPEACRAVDAVGEEEALSAMEQASVRIH